MPCLFVSPFGGAAIREVRDTIDREKTDRRVEDERENIRSYFIQINRLYCVKQETSSHNSNYMLNYQLYEKRRLKLIKYSQVIDIYLLHCYPDLIDEKPLHSEKIFCILFGGFIFQRHSLALFRCLFFHFFKLH